MTKTDREVITNLQACPTNQEYSTVVVRSDCAYAHGLLDHLAQRNIPIADVTEAQVEQYLCDAVALFQRRHSRLPSLHWHQITCAGIHALFGLVQLSPRHHQPPLYEGESENEATGTGTGQSSGNGGSTTVMETGYEPARLDRYALK
ncbi:hypothetical protein [Sedimentitalea todarodis]|uniref:Uncharacterized protein n=1 Tax=Sedimentitalea todarodis TaxID=1631240 RepID=A0ABU3VLS1_9RHOB|nr:hypothetical protein [Sedimentitalea todarodis]MDU9007110.1 hypothetical protein [Sedimentitalea todarodis]